MQEAPTARRAKLLGQFGAGMIKLKVVHAKEESGCAPAAIATVLGITYEKASRMFYANFEKTGADFEDLVQIIIDHGFTGVKKSLVRTTCIGPQRKVMEAPFADIHVLNVQCYADSKETHAMIMDKAGRIYNTNAGILRPLKEYYLILDVAGFWKN
jgi:hypothetical protein